MKVTVTDYGVGNLFSITRSLEKCGAEVEVVSDMSKVLDAECIVFPGVGAFDRTMEKLLPYRDGIRSRLESGVPALGICIGMQILFEGSDEGSRPGLGFYRGRVGRMHGKVLPHMGWNSVVSEDPIFEGVPDNMFYFVHSYCGREDEPIRVGSTEYEGAEFGSMFKKQNVYGTQFHPEKSSVTGMRVLRNFIEFAEECA
ncbi:MAG: imidazole glycerol phosphate synthase subunit HisH [Candidatus Methanomethylophilaceae archaeon]|nr:imidazole glycerol phosphate synthase subunit HisH [Candidatus Methanomethylophilaceae archaeon]